MERWQAVNARAIAAIGMTRCGSILFSKIPERAPKIARSFL
jgi:hypothetical protein